MALGRKRRIGRPLAYVGALGLVLFASGEILLRATQLDPHTYYVWPPNLRLDFEPSEAATPGVSGTGRFWTNSLGLRSDEPPRDVQQVIYVLGGSAAVDLFLDQEEAWVQQIQTKLNHVPGYPVTWVGNLAKSSLATVHNLMHFQHLLPELPRAELLLNLVGVNDLQLALKSSYLEDLTYEAHLTWAFSLMPARGEFWDRLATVRFYRQTVGAWKKSRLGVTQTYNADGYANWRRCRKTAPASNIVDELPDLRASLAQYRRNLDELIDRSMEYGAPMILATQPTIWAAEMGSAERDRLLAGGIGPNKTWCKIQRYYSPRALAEGMQAFNETLLDACRRRRVPCIDLAAEVPKRAELFYDDMHFSEQGARLVSDIVVRSILQFQGWDAPGPSLRPSRSEMAGRPVTEMP